MLSHSPPLPLIIYYPAIPDEISVADEESAIWALLQCDRVRRIHVAAPTTVLCNFFEVMDCEFPMLERLYLRLSTETRTGLGLPENLRAPLLHHLTLSNISLPMKSRLLRRADGLITLRLFNVPTSYMFDPAHLVAQLSWMTRLETLMVQFYKPIPESRFDSPALPTLFTLHSLKVLVFGGSNTYMEGILGRINAPLLSTLNVEFVDELTFNLSRMVQFVRRTGEFRFRSVELQFDKELVSLMVDRHPERTGSYPFLLQVNCQPLDRQAASVSQICHALEPVLADVEHLTLGFHKDGSVPWEDEIDVEMWHGILRTFSSVQSLRLSGSLVGDLFRSLQLDEEELPLDLLPNLRELVSSGRDLEHTDGSLKLTSVKLNGWFPSVLTFSLFSFIKFITVLAANGLVKRDTFSLPDPFAVITTDGSNLHYTAVVKKTRAPCWNALFDLLRHPFALIFPSLFLTSLYSSVLESSEIQIEVFDQRRFSHSDHFQGFLGSVSFTVGDVLNLSQSGSGMPCPPFS